MNAARVKSVLRRWPALAATLVLAAGQALPSERPPMDPEATNIYTPVPPTVTPGAAPGDAPSDALILFDGGSLAAWQAPDGDAPDWRAEAGVLHAAGSEQDLLTRRHFGDFQLHLEWRSADTADYERALATENARTIRERVKPAYLSQYAANSGVFLQDRYEIQVLETYGAGSYVNGLAGAVYKQHPPLVQALHPPGAWQRYDILWQAPRFGESGRVVVPGHVTVLVNGVVVQNHAVVTGATTWRGPPVYEKHSEAPLRLQSHHTIAPIYYRNIWIREL